MPLKEIDTFHALTCRYHTLTTLLNKKLILHKKKNQFNYHASKIRSKVYISFSARVKINFISTKKKKNAKIPLANNFILKKN
jgi:hypothetical protein